MANEGTNGRPSFVSTLPAGAHEGRFARGVVLVSGGIFLLLVPFARVPLVPAWAFIPIYESALVVNDLITAVLLVGQCHIVRSRALVVLACAYLFTAGMTIAHALTFPGLFTPTGLLGAGPQSTAWLYMFWHGGFPLLVMAYALLKDNPTANQVRGRTGVALGSGGVLTLAAVGGLTLLATAGAGWLPPMMVGHQRPDTLVNITILGTVWALSVLALAFLWKRRPHTVLDLWLLVVLFAWIFDVGLSAVFNAGRFDLGFYTGRIYGLLAASFILLVLLIETGRLYARDLTTRQQAETALRQANEALERRVQERTAALRESERRYRELVELAPDAVLVHQDGRIVYANAAALRLYGAEQPDQILGTAFLDRVPPEDRAAVQAWIERVQPGEGAPIQESRQRRLSGEVIRVETLASGIDWQGRAAIQAMIRDITDRKRLEAQLRQAQKMEAMGTLAGGIAHDFNNILSAIIGHAELLEDEVAAKSQAWAHLQEVLAAGGRAKELVRQILTFSRQSEQERRPVALHDIVVEAMRLLRASLPRTIEFRQQLEPGRALVLADPIQLHQILLNLCTNAEHAMRERGGLLAVQLKTVEVDAEFATGHPPLRPGSYAKLTVRDTGHGMTRQVRERIFDPFFTTKRPGEGTGMGLAVVHGIVVGYGGTIIVESAPGRGTRFDVYLPRCDAVEPLPIALEPTLRGQNERILLVEDEPSLVQLWTTMLEHLGYQVTACSNGLQALECFRAAPQSFDLVISDQTMPQLTGERLAREILCLRPHLPIILCTGFSHTLTEENAKALGIRAILQKPIGRQELYLTVQRVLAEKAAHSL